jgi:hypothetical protein
VEERDMRNQGGIFLILTVFLITSLPANALSQGKFTLKPKVSTTYRIDDNFWKAEAVEREVKTSLIKPGFELGYGTEKTNLSLDYTTDIYYYRDRDTLLPGWKLASDEDFVGHTGMLDIKTKPTDRLTLGVAESYTLTRDPGQADRFSNAVTRNKYYINRLTPLMFYDFGAKFGAGLKYRYTRTNYSEDVSEGSTENRGIFDLVYNLNKSTSLDLEYQYWARDYSISSDYTSHQIKAILRKQYKYFSLEAGGGYHERDFDKPGLKDVSMATWHVGLKGQYPSTASTPTSYISLGAESNFNDSGTGDRYYEASRFDLAAGHVFKQKVPFDLKASYQNSDYETETGLTPAGTTELRDDDTKNLEGSLGYIINEYLVIKVIAGYEERDSNISGRDYTNNYLMGRLDFIISLGRR